MVDLPGAPDRPLPSSLRPEPAARDLALGDVLLAACVPLVAAAAALLLR